MGLQEEANAAGAAAAKAYKPKKQLRWKAGSKFGMFCPLCGSGLLYGEDREVFDYKPVPLTCPKDCFNAEDGFPLMYEHPVNENQEGGDSWSLTWLK